VFSLRKLSGKEFEGEDGREDTEAKKCAWEGVPSFLFRGKKKRREEEKRKKVDSKDKGKTVAEVEGSKRRGGRGSEST